jgi:hypothetical protein
MFNFLLSLLNFSPAEGVLVVPFFSSFFPLLILMSLEFRSEGSDGLFAREFRILSFSLTLTNARNKIKTPGFSARILSSSAKFSGDDYVGSEF